MTTPQPAAMPEPFAWAWHNKVTGAKGVYFEDPQPFGVTSHPDYEWTHLYNEAQVLAALQSQPAAETALQKFVRLNVADEVRSPLEQLRSFCSFAMSGQDWIDCEPFFDAIVESEQPAAAGVSDAEIDRAAQIIANDQGCGWPHIPESWKEGFRETARAILALRPQSESKTYADGTTATGPAPLPDVSPAEQDASLAESLLTDLEAMLGGSSGASIKLRSLIRSLRPQVVPDEQEELEEEEFSLLSKTQIAALLWVLWCHQGASSRVGQPIRFALGMDKRQAMSDEQVSAAQRFRIDWHQWCGITAQGAQGGEG